MTVERAALVKLWPLVDVAKLDIHEGDLLVLNVIDRAITADPDRLGHVHDCMRESFPGVRYVVCDPKAIDFIVKRAMPEMRAEDLVQPERKGTME